MLAYFLEKTFWNAAELLTKGLINRNNVNITVKNSALQAGLTGLNIANTRWYKNTYSNTRDRIPYTTSLLFIKNHLFFNYFV